MDTRIGYPNEHLAGESDEEVASPLYATAVGLVMDGLRRHEKRRIEKEREALEQESKINLEQQSEGNVVMNQPKRERKSFLDKLTERVKDFLDNAE